MTALLPTTSRARRGWLALLLSVVLHAAFVTAVLFAPNPARRGGPGHRVIDQQVRNAGPEVRLFLDDFPTAVVLPPPPAAPQSPAPPEPTTAAGPAPPAPVIPVIEGGNAAPAAAPPVHATGPAATAPPAPVVQAAFGAAPSDGGGQGTVCTAFFEVPARGQSVVYVIDRSASMGQSRALAVARRELLASVDRLPPAARFQVVVYNRTAVVLQIDGRADLAPATPANKRQAAEQLHALHAEGSTDHLPALRRALALQPDVIYFLTDAGDLKADQVRAVTQLNRGRSVIHALVLGNDDGPALRTLARENRGEYRALAAPR